MDVNTGSKWRKWDLQIHTPYSSLNNQFGDNWDEYTKKLFKVAITAEVSVIGVTDYFHIEGYKKLKNEYLGNDTKLGELFTEEEIAKIKNIRLLSNIEFRLNPIAETKKDSESGEETTAEVGRVNLHVIFSDQVTDQDIEEKFLHDLHFVLSGKPFSETEKRKLKLSNLKELGEKLKSEHTNFKDKSDEYIGMMNAVVDDDEIMNVLKASPSVFLGKYVIVIDPNEDLSKLSWDGQGHNTRKKIIQKTNFFFSSNRATIAWGLGQENSYETPEDYIKEFESLKPSLWSSDAHTFEKLFKPDNEQRTWIKADPTFAGLKQVLNEPSTRVYIGKEPPNYKSNHNVIQKMTIKNSSGWFAEDFILELNCDLVAVIGGRGSGKSALAEMLAYGAGTLDPTDGHDSFIQKANAHKSPIKGSEIKLIWGDGSDTSFKVGDLKDDHALVRYLPQSAVEELCSPHHSEKLVEQIENVVFQSLNDSQKLGASSFQELKIKVLKKFDYEKKEIRSKMDDLNRKFADLRKLINALSAKQSEKKRIEENIKKLTSNLPKLPDADQKGQEELAELTKLKGSLEQAIISRNNLANQIDEFDTKQRLFTEKVSAIENEAQQLAKLLSVENHEELKIKIDFTDFSDLFTKKKDGLANEVKALRSGSREDVAVILGVDKETLACDNLEKTEEKIKEKEKETKAYETEKKKYQKHKQDITNAELQLKALEKEIDDIEKKHKPELSAVEKDRFELYAEFFSVLRREATDVEALYEPLQSTLTSSASETDAKLVFTAKPDFKLRQQYEEGLDILDRTKKGGFRSDKDLQKALDDLWEAFVKNDFDPEIITEAIGDFEEKFKTYNGEPVDIESQLRAQYDISDFHDWLFGTRNFEVISSIKFDGTDLYLLSPGQKGIVLLMLYLEIDKNDNRPLIIDQPEENLDNLSVYRDLIEYFRDRKQYRQIIVITHNPNLVVNTDAEQIIVAKFNGKGVPRLNYVSGSLENHAAEELTAADVADTPSIIEKVCDILEGGGDAFNKRKNKYKLSKHNFKE